MKLKSALSLLVLVSISVQSRTAQAKLPESLEEQAQVHAELVLTADKEIKEIGKISEETENELYHQVRQLRRFVSKTQKGVFTDKALEQTIIGTVAGGLIGGVSSGVGMHFLLLAYDAPVWAYLPSDVLAAIVEGSISASLAQAPLVAKALIKSYRAKYLTPLERKYWKRVYKLAGRKPKRLKAAQVAEFERNLHLGRKLNALKCQSDLDSLPS